MRVFLLTINVPVEVSGISLNITNQIVYIQIMLLLHISLNFPSRRFKFYLQTFLPKLRLFKLRQWHMKSVIDMHGEQKALPKTGGYLFIYKQQQILFLPTSYFKLQNKITGKHEAE